MKKKIISLCAVFTLAATTLLSGCSIPVIGSIFNSITAQPIYTAELNQAFTLTASGSDKLVVNIDVTNNSDSALDYLPYYNVTAKVNGTSLNSDYLWSDNPYYISGDTILAAGETATMQAVFDLSSYDRTSDTEVAISLYSYTTDYEDNISVLDETVVLSELEYMESVSDYELVVDNVTVTDDGDGNDILVIDFTFTNNSDDATSFGYACDVSIFQDGIELSSGYLYSNHPLYDEDLYYNDYTDIKSGSSIQVREVYELRSTSNVELEVTDYTSYDDITILSTEIQVQ